MNNMNTSSENMTHIDTQEAHDLTTYASLVYLFSENKIDSTNLAHSLTNYNFEVVVFNNLEEFRSAIIIRSPQAIVIDIDSEMGRHAKEAFARGVSKAFPVIYLSMDDAFVPRLQAVREGAAAYIIKPVDVDVLSAKLDEKIAKSEVLGFRVLIVDDDDVLASFYEAILSSAGMHVMYITNPLGVLDAIKKFKPEFILTDLNMPECSGIEMATVIRQNNLYLKIPIVFLSSVTESALQLSAIETGADEFLVKPIDPEKLILSVTNRAERYRALCR